MAPFVVVALGAALLFAGCVHTRQAPFYKTSYFYIVLVSSGLSEGLALEPFGDSGRSLAPRGLCAGCGDPRPVPISYYGSHFRGHILYAQAAWIRALWRLLAPRGRFPEPSIAPRGSLLYAQAAKIRVRSPFHMIL